MGGIESKLPETQWSVILAARTLDHTRRNLAIENILLAYWKPVYCYFLRRGFENEEAKDLTQEFFCKYLVEGKLLKSVDKQITSFRRLLHTALKRYKINAMRDRSRKKREPGGGLISLSTLEVERMPLPAFEATPEQAFEYGWVTSLLDQTLAETEKQCYEVSQETHWQVFRSKVLAPILDNADDIPMKKICQEYSLETETKACNMIVTVKRRFKRNLMRRLRDLTGSEAKAEEEFKEIMTVLSEKCARP